VEGIRTRGRPKETWSEIMGKDCQTRQICKEVAMDHWKWRKLIKDVLHRESKKGATLTMAITLSILGGFGKFFHCCKEQ